MNILPMTKNNIEENLIGLRSLILVVLLMLSPSAYAYDSYQLKVLFTPSESDLQAEADGRVMIYDSLKNETVERALNEQFWRIDRMMFIRTQYVQEDGGYETEEDGCD